MPEPPNGPPGTAGNSEEIAAVCVSLLAAYDADQVEPPLWLLDPVRYSSPYARFVPYALIRRPKTTDTPRDARVLPTS